MKATRRIKWYYLEFLPECSFCGKLEAGSKQCSHCVERHSDPGKRGKIRTKLHVAINDAPFQIFRKQYEDELLKKNDRA